MSKVSVETRVVERVVVEEEEVREFVVRMTEGEARAVRILLGAMTVPAGRMLNPEEGAFDLFKALAPAAEDVTRAQEELGIASVHVSVRRP